MEYSEVKKDSMPVWGRNQPDNGTFELYYKGCNFFPDVGIYAYTKDGDSAREWYRQNRVHHTMADNRNITKSSRQTARYITTLYPGSQAGPAQINAAFTQNFQETGVALDVKIDGKTYNLNSKL